MLRTTAKTNALLLGLILGLTAACVSRNPDPTDEEAQHRTELPETESAEARKAQRMGELSQQPHFTKEHKTMDEVTVTGSRLGRHADIALRAAPHVYLQREPLYRENYQRPEDNRVFRVAESPVSTFSIDVDTGAYSNTRRWLNQGQLPPENAVRVEEFINYFNYDYPQPDNRKQPFSIAADMAPTPWNPETVLLKVGIKGYQVARDELPPANLVFLIDVSGSMNSPDKLPLLKRAFSLLSRQLDKDDRISMVVYAGAHGVVLEPTAGDRRHQILDALDRLSAGGSTNGGAGIRAAYSLAKSQYIPDGVNRVILATDGDFNVGITQFDELLDMVERQRNNGIALTTLGFGSGNYNDHLLEQLADAGNGNHAYIDQLQEANKVLVQEMGSTLMTIAKDVKIQIEFNPAQVAEYRLIGYENRLLNEEDFNNDKVDAGDIGAGHTVTALYELTLNDTGFRYLPERRYAAEKPETRGRSREVAHLRVRYKLPGDDRSKLIETALSRNQIANRLSQTDEDFQFTAAVAAFGQLLRGGQYLSDFGYQEISQLARRGRGDDEQGYRGEFIQLLALAESLSAGVGAEGLAQQD